MINNSSFEGTGRADLPNVLVFILKLIVFTPYDAPKSLRIAYLQQTLMSYIREMYEKYPYFIDNRLYRCNIATNGLFMQCIFLVFLQGNICYHGNDKKMVTS